MDHPQDGVKQSPGSSNGTGRSRPTSRYVVKKITKTSLQVVFAVLKALPQGLM